MKLKVPYFVWRDGRPRWVPGPKLRQQGFKGRDLKDDDGRWLPLEAAIAAANALTAATQRPPEEREAKPRRGEARTCRALYKIWTKSPSFLSNAPGTQTDYMGKVEIFLELEIEKAASGVPDEKKDRAELRAWLQRVLKKTKLSPYALAARVGVARFTIFGFLTRDDAAMMSDETVAKIKAAIGETLPAKGQVFGDAPVSSLRSYHLYGAWEYLMKARGHATANGVIRAVSVMFSHGRRKGWCEDNPASKLGMESVPPRLMLWLPEQVSAIVSMADRLGLHSVGDAVVIALHSGQRQADVLAMPERLFDDRSIRLSQLRMKMRQKKTHALIDAPMTPACQGRIAAIKARRRAAAEGGDNIVDLNAPIIRRDDTGEPHDKNSLGRRFREVRAAAAAEKGDDGELRYPGIETLQFLDLRDTAVTRLALADCTLPQIAAITGHSLQSITDIMKHYLVLQPQMADEAIAKLTAWLEREGIAL
ncbi:putative Tyr recombinase domain-containing protein [Hyphomicrobium sp. 1Nfss2.1]|uniref:hypothetical protein n=1 Tax=Hyphomicrobium sp. 1Nfss2.1 TaxID=3413936 RepID=UPI003C7A202B